MKAKKNKYAIEPYKSQSEQEQEKVIDESNSDDIIEENISELGLYDKLYKSKSSSDSVDSIAKESILNSSQEVKKSILESISFTSIAHSDGKKTFQKDITNN